MLRGKVQPSPCPSTRAKLNSEKRVAVVTGAAQGIGRRASEVLAERGYRVALVDLRMPNETIGAIQDRGGEAFGHVGDITDESVVEAFARHVYDTWGRADALVNNAGIAFISPAESTDAKD